MLIENFKKGKVRGLSCLIIDDEADQASPNTRASRDDGSPRLLMIKNQNFQELSRRRTFNLVSGHAFARVLGLA